MASRLAKEEVLRRLKGGLIVSCQAEPERGSQLAGPDDIARMTREALLAGAVGVRICGIANIRGTRSENPGAIIIGITKALYPDGRVLITPDVAAIEAIAHAGADIVGMDLTARPRPNGPAGVDLLARAKERFPEMLFLADIATEDEARAAVAAGVDLVATTLSGYTPDTESRRRPDRWYEYAPDEELLRALVRRFPDFPIIAEGRWRSPEYCHRAVREYGAFAVCDGSAMTRIRETVRWRLKAIKDGGYLADD